MNRIITKEWITVRNVAKLMAVVFICVLFGERILWFLNGYDEANQSVKYHNFMCGACTVQNMKEMGKNYAGMICPLACGNAEQPPRPIRAGFDAVFQNTYSCIDIACMDIPGRVFSLQGALVAVLVIWVFRFTIYEWLYVLYSQRRIPSVKGVVPTLDEMAGDIMMATVPTLNSISTDPYVSSKPLYGAPYKTE